MNREKTRKAIEVMQAWLDGETDEFFHQQTRSWHLINKLPEWGWGAYEYRIKPEPMEFWVDVDDSGHPECVMTVRPTVIRAGLRRIKVKEVME